MAARLDRRVRQGAVAADNAIGINGEIGRGCNRTVNRKPGASINNGCTGVGVVTAKDGIADCGAVLRIAEGDGACSGDGAREIGGEAVTINGVGCGATGCG